MSDEQATFYTFEALVALNDDDLDEIVELLIVKNETALKKLDPSVICFKRKNIVKFIFLACDLLKLPIYTKYYAIEIFLRFSAAHMKKIWTNLLDVCGGSNSSVIGSWMEVEERLEKQIVLRALSSVQLASKLCSMHQFTKNKQLRELLAKYNLTYSNRTLVKSEFRVLKELDFRLFVPMPLVYVGCLFALLGKRLPLPSIREYYKVAVKLLDLYYLHTFEIFVVLRQKVSGNQPEADLSFTPKNFLHDDFLIVHNDFVLLSSATIVASVFVLNPSLHRRVVSFLNKALAIPKADVVDLASALLTVFLQLAQRKQLSTVEFSLG